MLTVILGAGKGLGRHLATTLAYRCETLVLSGRSLPGLEETASMVHECCPTTTTIVKAVDLTLPSSLEVYIRQLGDLRMPLRAFITTAAGFYKGAFKDQSAESVHELVASNYVGVVALVSGLIRLLDVARPLDIINVTSLSAATNLDPGRSSALHIASKAALQVFDAVVGRELSTEGIRVTSLAPGTFARSGRSGISEQTLARCVEFLLDLPPDAWIESLAIRPLTL